MPFTDPIAGHAYKLAYCRRWRKANPDKYKGYELIRRYGITLEQYNSLKAKQNGLCPICKRELKPGTRIGVDHCHKTNRVRGIVHQRCNVLLGLAEDNPNILWNAIEYLSP